MHQCTEIGCQLGSHFFVLPDAGMIIVAIAEIAVLRSEVKAIYLFVACLIGFCCHLIENLFGKGKVTASMDAAQYKNAKANVFVHSYATTLTETWSITVGEAFPEDERPTVPLIIEDSNGVRKQFYRWKITEADKGSDQEEKLVGYCYFNEFTFMVWDDYDIVPEYVPMTGDEYHRYYPDDEQTAYVNVDFLKNTRNQWVDLESDNQTIKYDESGNATYNDALISDYSIIFIDHGLRINTNPDNYQVGLMYEVVGEVDDDGVTTDSSYSETTEEYRKDVINAIQSSITASSILPT